MRVLERWNVRALVALTAALSCCSEARDDTGLPPTYHGSVATILDARCASCHSGAAPAGGWRADTYLGAIGCTADGTPAIGPGPVPILTALDRPDHAGFATADERDELARWIAAGAPSIRSGTHDASFADPRSPDSHGRFLRAMRWRPMLDPKDPDACGKCHDGAPTRPAGAQGFAPGATPCTTCHTDPGGALACSTCHGSPGKASPPRDKCFFPDDPPDVIHPAHTGPSPSNAGGLPCSTCHPQPAQGQFDGTHGDGHVEVWFDYAVAGNQAHFDETTKQCTGTCHDKGGARPGPSWTETTPMTCNDCHTSPPANHYAGACTSCHKEANATGTALVDPHLHVNGKVDLGDGSGKCGACHGAGDRPWPSTGAHLAHLLPKFAAPVSCDTCHPVPGAGDKHPLGLGAPIVRLVGLATAGARHPTYDPQTKTCADTYCHAGPGASVPAPKWTDGPKAITCGGCHAIPPSAPHSTGTNCSTTTCHQGSTTLIASGPVLTPAGAKVHVNGVIDRQVP